MDTASISRNVVVDVPVVSDAKPHWKNYQSGQNQKKKTTAQIARIEEWKKKILWKCEEIRDFPRR